MSEQKARFLWKRCKQRLPTKIKTANTLRFHTIDKVQDDACNYIKKLIFRNIFFLLLFLIKDYKKNSEQELDNILEDESNRVKI